MTAADLPAELARLVADARERAAAGFPGTARVIAGFAGTRAHAAGLTEVRPFDLPGETDLAAAFADGLARGTSARIPTAEVVRPDWKPRPGTTHAAQSHEVTA